MITRSHVAPSHEPALRRLSALTELDAVARHALEQAIAASTACKPRTELMAEGHEIAAPLLVVEGWAAHVRILPYGRRQFLHFLLPGDLIGVRLYAHPLATSSVIAVTPTRIGRAPEAGLSPSLARVYALNDALERAYLLAQITRLGRLNAHERLADFLLELHERFALAGLVRGDGRFDMPLTQEVMADVLGLTPVHVNRVVQHSRRDGWLEWRAKRVTIHDPEQLAALVGRQPVRVRES